MEDRNSNQSIKKDVLFLSEMLYFLKNADRNLVSFDHLKIMIQDWRTELMSDFSAKKI